MSTPKRLIEESTEAFERDLLASAKEDAMSPKAKVTPNTVQTRRLLSSAHRSVLINVATRMSVPPIVGVPALTRWVCGPSSRTTCPTGSSYPLAILCLNIGLVTTTSSSPGNWTRSSSRVVSRVR